MKTAREQVIEQMGMTPEMLVAQFDAKQKQPYEFKREYARIRVDEFYNHPSVNGNCYIAVGGLDSITLLMFIRSLGYWDIPAVSVSSLEDKSIQRIHKALGVQNLLPSKDENGKQWSKVRVLREFGYPVISKEKANKIALLQKGSPESATVRHAIITGETGAYGGNQKNSRMKLPNKWLEKFGGADPEGAALGYKAAPFKVSDRCCYYLKEKPCNDYAKESGRYPIMGLMASEGGRREKALKLHGCNYISKGTKRSAPFAIFNRTDVLKLAQEMDVWYQEHWQEFGTGVKVDTIVPSIYGTIEQKDDGTLDTTGAKRTGCAICMFGIHIEKRPHRFDKLREVDPKQWEFWMYRMGFGEVLTYIGVGWEDEYKQ